MNDVNYATYTSTGKREEERATQPLSFVVDDGESSIATAATTTSAAVSNINLVPLSTKPLLLVSSGAPVLSPDDCQHLSSYFVQKTVLDNKENDDPGALSKHPGQDVLEKLQTVLDELILRPEDTIVEPRFLFYEKPTVHDATSASNDMLTGNNPILPDGLHVDTNNGKYFRYCTVLVYLTTSHAATVFPLANSHSCEIDDLNNAGRCLLHQQQLQHSAEYLIQNHIQHTRQKVDVEPPSPSSSGPKPHHQDRIKDIQQKQRLIENAVSSSSCVRIVPQMGHIAVFFNINPQTGYADPYSFHGSEVSYDEKKLLTFFYELLPNSEQDLFHTPMEFGQRIQKRIHSMQQKYVSLGR